MTWMFDYDTADEFPILERLSDLYEGGVFEIRFYKNGRIKRYKAMLEALKGERGIRQGEPEIGMEPVNPFPGERLATEGQAVVSRIATVLPWTA